MALRIDRETYTVVEAEDFWPCELDYEIEVTRELMDDLTEAGLTIPEELEELLITLTELEEELF